MDNNDLREHENLNDQEEEKSLIKDVLKKEIAKKIKGMPLKTKLWIIGIVIGILGFIILFSVLITALSMFFFFDFNGNSGQTVSGFSYISTNDESNYWWPIGGSEVTTYNGKEFANGKPTTTHISSSQGYRDMDGDGVKEDYHAGIDISESGTHYIIAIANGTVYTASDTCSNQGYYGNVCGGGGFGNYVIIEHANGIYSIYAHLAENSITVKSGEDVKQGQIIGIMGNSGSSTGQHLHFQIEQGSRSTNNAVNPLDFVSKEKPRPVTSINGSGGNLLLDMLQSWEGTGKIEDNSYIVYNDGTGALTVGHGVTIKNHEQRFKSRGIDTSSMSVGSRIEISIVDDIEMEIVNEMRNKIINMLNKNDISLNGYQIDALTIRMYNVGNVNSFPENYKKYGNTINLYDNYMNKPISGGGREMTGLARRRQAEWKLFHTGEYTFNS